MKRPGTTIRAGQFVTKAMQTYWRNTRALTLGAQGCALTPDNRVLLIKHTYRPGWHFPGGGVEKNETILSALTREMREEAGVVFGAPPELFAIYANFRAFPGDHIALYVIRDWRQPTAPRPNAEIAAHGLFPADALPDDTHPPTRARLEEILEGAPASPNW